MRRVLALSDCIALAGAWLLAMAVTDALGRGSAGASDVIAGAVLIPVWILLAIQMGLYHRADRRLDPSIADEAGLIVTLVTVWSWLYLISTSLTSSGPSAVFPAVLLWLVAIVSIIMFRAGTRAWARRRDWFIENVVIIGKPNGIERVRSRLSRHPEFGLRVVAEESLPDVGGGPASEHEEVEFADAVGQLVGEVKANDIARAIIATGPRTAVARSELVRSLNEAGVQVDLVAGEPETVVREPVLNYLEGLLVVTIPVTRRHKLAQALKRMQDLSLSLLALAVLSPLFAFCAIRIKIESKGPVFFKQKRIGKGREPFWIWKFRSMVDGADEIRSEMVEAMREECPDDRELFKIKQDPRVTKFGAFMRRLSIDELPQLFNVVRGQMSLVGPRPLPTDEAVLIDGHYDVRFRVRPGVTGAWQAHGRSEIGFEDMLKLDYAYVMGWTLREDVKLMIRTVEVIAQGRGAY